MKVSFFDKCKSFFVRDKMGYWFDHFTDEEKRLKTLTVWELAEIISKKNNEKESIVAEHLLNIRLARIQSRATTTSAFIGLIGVILGVIITHFLQ
ncbi:MAG: hypothetical protein U9R28_10435 [Pseudomonadota bacterium]|nr:hypothetical protein [Pseudomonadota bacterium]